MDTPIPPVLLAEDSIDDIIITRRMWKKAKIRNHLYTVKDGSEALDFLFKKEKYQDAPTVGLVLLDINMPKIDGFMVLKEVRNSVSLRDLPVFLLSGSNNERDREKAFELGCEGYLFKPLRIDAFFNALMNIQGFTLYFTEKYSSDSVNALGNQGKIDNTEYLRFNSQSMC